MIIVLIIVVCISGFTQENEEILKGTGMAIQGTFNFFDPWYTGAGVMFELIGMRLGASLGFINVTYETKNVFSSTGKMTEYWQRSFLIELIGGYAHQINISENLALRLGGDIVFSTSPAYQNQHRIYGNSDLELFNWAFTGVTGVKIFPQGKIYLTFDICPGWATTISAKGKGAFIVPLRFGFGWH